MLHDGTADDLFGQESVGGGPTIQLAVDYTIKAEGIRATSW